MRSLQGTQLIQDTDQTRDKAFRGTSGLVLNNSALYWKPVDQHSIVKYSGSYH
jgi:hypothetical protein